VLCFDAHASFDEEAVLALLRALPGVRITARRVVEQSVGPAYIVTEYATTRGTLTIEQRFEDFDAGVSIYAGEAALMDELLGAIAVSGRFQLRSPAAATRPAGWRD
jgi:hypothetical protein